MKKLVEHTYGTHIYMKLELNKGSVEEVDMFLTGNGNSIYKTTKDGDNKLREEIIKAFNELY